MTAIAVPAGDDLPGASPDPLLDAYARAVVGQTVPLTVIRRGGRLAVDIVPAWAGA